MVNMKMGDRVKNEDGRKGTITSGDRRPSPAGDPEPSSRITHWGVKWDDTGTEDAIRVKDVAPIPSFSEPDLLTLKAKYPAGHHGDDEFIAAIEGVGIKFTAQDDRRITLEFSYNNGLETNEVGTFQELSSALKKAGEYRQHHLP